MKKMLCPQCKIAAMYVKNEAGERRLVYVTSEGVVVPKKEVESREGFDKKKNRNKKIYLSLSIFYAF